MIINKTKSIFCLYRRHLCFSLFVFLLFLLSVDYFSSAPYSMYYYFVVGANVQKVVILISILIISIYIFDKYDKCCKLKKYKKYGSVLSIVLSVLFIIGGSFKRFASVMPMVDSFRSICLSMFIIIGYAFIFYCIINILYSSFSHFNNEGFFNFKFGWIILLLFWIPYYIISFPGNVTWDAIYQIGETMGNLAFNVNNPPFQVYLVYICMKIGGVLGSFNLGVAFYSLLQSILFSFSITYSIKIMNKIGLNKKLSYYLLLFFAIIPVFPCYAFTMGKDTLFASFILIYVFLCIKCVKIKFDRMDYIAYFIILLLLCLLRNIGFLLVILMGFSFFILIKDKKIIIIHLLVLLFNFLYLSIVLPFLDIPNPEMKENMSIQFQQIGRYVAKGGEIEKEDIITINKVIDYSIIKDQYNPEISDPIKDTYKKDATNENVEEFYKVWLKYMMKDPITYISATLNNCYGYLFPLDEGKSKPYVQIGYANTIDSVRELELHNIYNIAPLNNFFIEIRKIPIFSLFLKIGIYSWLLLISVCYSVINKSWENILFHLPVLFVLIGCCASPVNAYFRYALPIVVCSPILLMSNFIEKRNTL